MIAGAVIGSLIFLGIIIGVILCVVKKNGHRGTLIAPSGAPTTQHTSVAFGTLICKYIHTVFRIRYFK